MTATSTESVQAGTRTVQVYRIYIRATPQRIWDAITKPEWTERYGYAAPVEFDLRKGGAYRSTASEAMKQSGKEMGFDVPDVIIDGEVVECDPPRKLVQTWHALWDEGVAGEQPTRVTWDIEEDDLGFTRLTVTHELEGAPIHDEQVSNEAKLKEGGGGWSWILSDVKTLLGTGNES